MATKIIDNCALTISGKVFRTATVRDEPYTCLTDPQRFLGQLKEQRVGADLLTFMQEVAETTPRHSFYAGWESLAVIPVSTYENWFRKQINDKTRNMVRKPQKQGVEIRVTPLDDEFVKGVVSIYNETPVRQGKPFTHYGKDFETIKKDLSTFPDRSEFIGAYFKGELIGFIKLVWGNNVVSLMHILSKVGHRDKAPTNGLVAKAVEICAERKVAYLHYSVWSRRGLGDFKKHHGFVQHNVPRYYVPLNWKGRLMLKLNLHRGLVEFIPEKWVDGLILLRSRWNLFRASS
jgi:hypothetical protein